jgi:hypothetical protein
MSCRVVEVKVEEKKEQIHFYRENPFLKLINIEFEDDIKETHYFDVYAEMLCEHGGTRKIKLNEYPAKNNKVILNRVVDLTDVVKLFVYCGMDMKTINYSGKINLSYDLLDRMSTTIPSEGFEAHLNDLKNVKILFSAPFGQGKTTFLESFFADKEDEYNVFKVFPINYSVATNKDVFRYIKTDILYQLLNSNVAFDKVDFSYSESFVQFFRANGAKVLAPFLMALPQIGQSAYKVYEKLNILHDEFLNFNKEVQVVDKSVATEFIKELIEEEGSIYEDNFFTQLIRQLLDRLKGNMKKNVLIIDDLDRMDPEHIFRVLNVLSAHYDVFNQDTTQESNKFGFDKIIVVADVDNLKSLFEHKYGLGVGFDGYINKYYSTMPYKFQNKKEMESMVENIDNFRGDTPDSSDYLWFFNFIAVPLIRSNQITLRDLIKLRSITLEGIRNNVFEKNRRIEGKFTNGAFTSSLVLLSKIGNGDTLLGKVRNLNETHFFEDYRLSAVCEYLVGSLANGQGSIIYRTRGNKIVISSISERLGYEVIRSYQVFDDKDEVLDIPKADLFQFEDLKKLLELNVEKLIDLKHQL